MKKFYFILIVGIIFFIISLVKKQYRFRLTAMFLVVVTVANVFYNSAGLEKIISLIRPVNQLIYQPEYEEELKYPDAVLPFIIKGKKIHMKNDFLRIHESKELGFGWVYSYYHVHNAMNFVNHNGAEAIMEDELNDVVIDESILGDFEDIGYGNEMMRSTILYTRYKDEEVGNYFYYYWYYGAEIGDMHVYVNMDGIYDSDELVWICQRKAENDETENMYIMTKDYFESKVKK